MSPLIPLFWDKWVIPHALAHKQACIFLIIVTSLY